MTELAYKPAGTSAKGLASRLRRIINKESNFQIALVAPLQLLLWFLLIVPTIIVLYLSIIAWQPILGDWTKAPIVWLKNYGEVLSDPLFWAALGRTAAVVAIAVSLEFIIGLSLALLFSGEFFAKRILTSVILYPMMLPWVVVGFTFYLLFLPQGPVNYLLRQVLGPGAVISWFKEPLLAFSTIVLADVWQWTPFMFLILYSGLGALPREPVEAAMTLGASRWQIFRHVTLPMLKPILIIALVIRALEAFKIFDLIFIMTDGGPGTSTESISLYIYRLSFEYQRLSYAAAMAVLILLLVTLITRMAIRPLEYQE